MSSLRARRVLRAFAIIGLGLLALALLAACDGGDDDGVAPTATPPEAPEPTRTPDDSLDLPEIGEAPFFWRTEDGFQSVRAGEPYKVGLRVTNGYDEEMLLIVAEPEGGGPGVELEASRVEPVGPEEPGTFYHFLLELPEPGRWQLTTVAGDDEVTVAVEVRPADPSTRY